jgi:hypothetical protein
VVQVIEHPLKVLVVERSMTGMVISLSGEVIEAEVELVDLAGEFVVWWRVAWP